MKYFLICLLGIAIQFLFINAEKKEQFVKAVILKGTASLVFVILGIICSKQSVNTDFSSMVIKGLLFGMGGDILLNLRMVFPKKGMIIFLIGILVFLTGHIMYMIALIPLCEHLVLCLIIGVILTVITLVWIFSKIEAKLPFKIFGVFYLGAIIIMTTIAAVNFITQPCANRLIYLVGALLFTASDIVLILNTFGKESKFSLRVTNLSLYYLGQLMIGLSLLFI